MRTIVEWDEVRGEQLTRPCTLEEEAALLAESQAPVPREVTIRQAQLALYAAGVLGSIDQYIGAIEDEDERNIATIEWNKATTVRRDWWLTLRMGEALGLTSEQLDDMFRYAATK